MADKDILATYRDVNGNFNYDWLEDEELEEWIEESKLREYTQVKIIRVNVIEEIYESEDELNE